MIYNNIHLLKIIIYLNIVFLKYFFFKILNFFCFLIIIILFQKCIDPTVPEFQFSEDLIFIDGFITDKPKGSFVSVKKSKLEFGIYKTETINGCIVSFVNSLTNKSIPLTQIEEVYLPSDDFKINSGERWELNVILPTGENYKSFSETAPTKVELNSAESKFKDKVTTFTSPSGTDRDISGHKIFVNFDDPLDEENYYFHRFRVYEQTITCLTCPNGIYRNGECLVLEPPVLRYLRNRDFTYGCEVPCWNINYNDETTIFSDEFSNGLNIKSYEIGNVPLFSVNPFFLTVQQFNITKSAYNYYKTLKDISENSSSLNAPLPTALVGNLYNSNDLNEFVLGRFTVASESNISIFQDRVEYGAQSVSNNSAYGRERLDPEIYGMPLPEPLTFFAPCQETRFRTSIVPEGWYNFIQN